MTKGKESASNLNRKWSRTLIKAGWTAIPSIVLEKQDALGLDAVDVNILMHRIRHWWYRDNLPYPAKKTIAKCMGVNVSTIRRHVARMQAANFIARIKRTDPATGRQESNHYDLQGLIGSVLPFAREAVQQRQRHRAEAAERLRRKRPKASPIDVAATGGAAHD